MSENLKRETREHSDFSKVELLGAGYIHLKQGDTFSIEIEAEDDILPYLTSEVKEGRLLLDIEEDAPWRFSGKNDVHYYITMPKIEALRILGGGKVEAGTITGAAFLLDLPGGADINIQSLDLKAFSLHVEGGAQVKISRLQAKAVNLDIEGSLKLKLPSLDVDALTANISGTINSDISGRADAQIIHAPGVLNYQAAHLQSRAVTLNAEGVATLTLWVNELLTVHLEGMGNLRYYGNPKRSIKIEGLAHVQRLGDAPKTVSLV